MSKEIRFTGRLQKAGGSIKIDIPKPIRGEVKRMFGSDEIHVTIKDVEYEEEATATDVDG